MLDYYYYYYCIIHFNNNAHYLYNTIFNNVTKCLLKEFKPDKTDRIMK